MNNYHIYEAIGNGKHSAVYKGRKKKTIEYYAIKSVDKSQRPKVLREVRMLHPMNHPNILKFYAWYETNAHLWLVLEYCVGGDLRKLLDTDSKLHESSIHDLALNLVLALQYLHSQGIVYCDLKPSNILMDEFGRVKLCDFGLARKLTDTDKNTPSMAMQGTPYYMAPELFEESGTHSYASDFWALGCVLYECYTGKPPFAHRELTKLVNSIVSDPTPPLPDLPSKSLQNLIDSLLIKDPNERLQWPQICQHSYWQTKLDPLPLPLQVQVQPNPLSERNNSDAVVSRQRKQKDETPSKTKPVLSTPTKSNVQGGRRTGTTRPINKGVNILRLSRAAKVNLQREKDKENYRCGALTKDKADNDAEVKLENKDMELNFSETPEEDEPEDVDTSEETLQTQNGNTEQSEVIDTLMNEATPEGSTNSDRLEAVTTPPPSSPAPSSTPIRRPHGMDNNKIVPQTNPNSSSFKDHAQVFWHQSDLLVKPVMPGRKTESVPSTVLPFDPVPSADYIKLPQEKLDAFNTRILHVLGGTSQVSEKQNVLKYLEVLSMNSEAANVLTNGPVMLLLVKMLRLSKSLILKVQVASLVGLLIRHSTVIEADLASSGIIGALTNGLRDKQDRLRRFCMASLGELLFYVATQSGDYGKEENARESPLKDSNKSSSIWQVPSSLIALVCSMLGKGEDDLAQLYALRTIDNISTQGIDWTSRFACHDVISNLSYIYKSTSKQENTRLIAGSCLVRLARFSPSCIQFVFDKLSLKEIVITLLRGSPREQQTALNLLNLALVNSSAVPNMSRHMVSLAEEKQLVPSVISILEQGTEVLRGKTLLFCALLCKTSRRWLSQFVCNVKVLSVVDRLGKESCEFVQRCTESFVELVVSLVPGVLETVFGEIQVLIGGRRHIFRGGSNNINPKNTMNLFPLFLHLLGSFMFKDRVVSTHVMAQLADLTKLFETHFPGRDDIQITLLRILEAISEEPALILKEHKIFTSRILPSLCILYKGNKDDDARFLCLKILMDVMLVICNDTSLATNSETTEDLRSISQTHFLPLYPVMVQDEDPIPMFAQKLLVMLIEFGYVNVSDILHLRTVAQCFKFLDDDLSNVNVSNVKLCLALASACEMDPKILSELRVVRKIGNLLEFLMTKGMDEFLEPTLGLCKAFVLCAVGRNKGEAVLKKPALLCDNAFEMSMAVHQQYSIKDIGDFGSNMGMFLELTGSTDPQIADLASGCVVLLVRGAPREGTMGLLTNLPKIACVIHSLNKEDSKLRLLHVMYALAFSCKQYLAHAMILSLPVQALVQVENLVSALKRSNLPDVSNAAGYLAIELERLPHYA